jgi:RNA ligase (TIGR02306 family)
MRKLASIRRIAEIKPIEGADAIEAVRVDGWWCVTKKNELKVNDLCVYFEVDSFLPVRPEFEFLRKACFKSTKHLGDGFRLKTVKLRGQISQGLVLPMSTFDGWIWNNKRDEYIVRSSDNIAYDMYIPVDVGDDLTNLIGVQKWEAPISPQLAGVAKGNFPTFIRKTDQERIQNCYSDLVKTHKDVAFEATLKLDGSSMTVYFNDGQFGVCSRNLELKETEDNTFWKVARKLNLEAAMRSYGKNIALQGELMGPGVQGNREALKEHNFYLFDVWNIDEQCYKSSIEKHDVWVDLYDHGTTISRVPFLGVKVPLTVSLEELIAESDIKSVNHHVAEGIVYRTMDGSVSFKVINNKFLLQEK